MKKFTAFLTIITLIAIPSMGYYLFVVRPELFEPERIQKLIDVTVTDEWSLHVTVISFLLWLNIISLATVVLFEPASTSKKHVEDLTKNLEKSKKGLLETKKDNEELQQKLQELESKLKELNSQIDDNDKTLVNSKNELEAVIKKLDVTEKEKEKIAGQLSKLDKSSQKLQKEAEEKDKLISEQTQKLKDFEQELKAANANLKGGKNAIPPVACQILYLFQKEGRFIDLMMEDISDFDDETLGGAVRPIHEGCQKLLKERLVVEPVLQEEEGNTITINEADPDSVKLTGDVPSKGPYTGELVHSGWRIKECNLPEIADGWKGNVVAPAEIEI